MIERFVMKFVSDLWQVGGFLQVLWFPSLVKHGSHLLQAYVSLAIVFILLHKEISSEK
jgi:hypothetical protein